MEMTDSEESKCTVLVNKGKERGYSYDTMFMCGVLAFCKENHHRAGEILEKFIEFIDESKNEDEFVEKATGLFNL